MRENTVLYSVDSINDSSNFHTISQFISRLQKISPTNFLSKMLVFLETC